MAYKKPDFEQIYTLNNVEVVDFCKLTDLKKSVYGYQYQLKILADDGAVSHIQKDADNTLVQLKKDYDTTAADFKRISKILKTKKDKATGKVIEKIPCPKGKTLINLNTNAKEKDGIIERVVHVFDAQNNPVGKVNIYEGSIVNVQFKLKSYTTNNGHGLSIILRYVQIVKLETQEKLSADSPFEANDDGFNIKDIEDEYTEAQTIEDGDPVDEEEI